ncbi:hypothetical protein WH47_05968 [Habropoda laboriosa]|uniref:Uncharacterized protein n=1 Tax=Habropoda laboriosa TaxID=597456 RepID=A0A0L7REP9_9HYME|nr:hypothetical protein WH47_05968 [Habropoda laboriosa]
MERAYTSSRNKYFIPQNIKALAGDFFFRYSTIGLINRYCTRLSDSRIYIINDRIH